MAATRVEAAFTNGTGASAIPSTIARSEAFYGKLLQLHKDVVAGKHPRLTFAQATQQLPGRTATTTSVPTVTHPQTEATAQHLPGLSNNAASQPFASSAVPATGTKSSISNASTPAKVGTTSGRNEPTDDPVRLKRIKEQRQQLERSIAEYAKADEPILKNAREIPLNLLALAHAQVPPVSGLKNDSSDDSFDEDSYYSSKANSWSTEHTEPQQARPDAAIVISDEDNEELYEPPPQVHGSAAGAGVPKVQGIQRMDTVNSNGEWEPDWDEEDDYEPPAPAAFGGPRPQQSTASHRHASGQMQAPEYMKRLHASSGSGRAPQMPGMVAVNQIPTPVAPQPSRISPLTTSNITQAIQSQISNIHQAQTGILQHGDVEGNSQIISAKEQKKQRRLAKKEAKAASTVDSAKKRKRPATPGQSNSTGKRRAVDHSPQSFIKPEPASPLSGMAAIPPRRPSVVHRTQRDPTVQSSPYRPRSAYTSEQETSPHQTRYTDNNATDRVVMPPPKPGRRYERGEQDLRRVASLQYARRPLSPGQEYAPYGSSSGAAPRYGYEERPLSRATAYREVSMRPPAARLARSPSPRGSDPYAPIYPSHSVRPGTIVTDEYGRKYVAEVDPAYLPQSRRPHPDELYEQYQYRRPEVYAEDPYLPSQFSRGRAYSQMPEPLPTDRRTRAYSHMPEPIPESHSSRAYSIHSGAAAQHRERREDDPEYERRRGPSRYDAQTSPQQIAYSADYPPIARAYSTRPDVGRREMLPEYASARAGSMAPERFTRRGDMAPPALPVMRTRNVNQTDDGYQQAVSTEGRDQYGDRRSVSYRY